MCRLSTRAVILSCCLFCLCALAQENQVVKVGVAVMQNKAGRSVSGSMERDRLVAALNQLKPDKKLHFKVQAVPLEGMTPEDAGDEAQQKKCAYVVYTTLIELQSSTDPAMRPRPGTGTVQSNPNGVWGMPNNPEAGAMNPEYAATVEYRLYRAGGSGSVAGAPFSNRQAADEETVVAGVMNRIANQVFAEIKKGPAPMQE